MLFAVVPVANARGDMFNVLPSGTMLVRRDPPKTRALVYTRTHARMHWAHARQTGPVERLVNAPALDFIRALSPEDLREALRRGRWCSYTPRARGALGKEWKERQHRPDAQARAQGNSNGWPDYVGADDPTWHKFSKVLSLRTLY